MTATTSEEWRTRARRRSSPRRSTARACSASAERALDAVHPPAQQAQQQHAEHERGHAAQARPNLRGVGAVVLAACGPGRGRVQARHGRAEGPHRHLPAGVRVAARDRECVDADPVGGADVALDLVDAVARHAEPAQLAHAGHDFLVGLQARGQGPCRGDAPGGQAAPRDDVDALGPVAHALHQDLRLARPVGGPARAIGHQQHAGDDRQRAGQQREDAQRAHLHAAGSAAARPAGLGETGSHVPGKSAAAQRS